MRARIIAFYLPQFFPTEINNYFWGNGFTEWTNVAQAKPLFFGHYQPRIPADLGFYDLRLAEIAESQANLAKSVGIEGFCYWNYWFGDGLKILDEPLKRLLKSGSPDFPFCIGWANHSWTTKSWTVGNKWRQDRLIFQQKYLGENDWVLHFEELLPYFLDSRYIKVDGKPLFYIWNPTAIPQIDRFIKFWQQLARENGLKGLYFIGRIDPVKIVDSAYQTKPRKISQNIPAAYNYYLDNGFDGINAATSKYAELQSKGAFYKNFIQFSRKYLKSLVIEKYNYFDIVSNLFTKENFFENIYPQLIVGYDKTPRLGRQGVVYLNNTPNYFRIGLKKCLECVRTRDIEHRIIFLYAWNEWGEGAYLEPDVRYKHEYLNVVKDELMGEGEKI